MLRRFILVIAMIMLFTPQVLAAENYILSDPQVFTVVQTETISNPSKKVSKDITVTISLFDTNQPPYQTFLGEEFNPRPAEIYRNSNGSRFGIWKIDQLNPGEKVVITQKYAVRNYAIEFQLDSNAGLGKYRDVPMRYLLPESRIEADNPEILAYAKEVIGDSNNPYDIAKYLFEDISTRLNYVLGPPNANKGALNALHSGEGVCDDYAALFVASARSLNVPARWTAGYLYQPEEYLKNRILDDGSIDLSNLRHAWPEFMLPRVGWVVLDPTYTYYVDGKKTVNYSKFAKIAPGDRHIFSGYENSRIEYWNLYGAKPEVEFTEQLQFGKHIVIFPDIQKHWAKDNVLFLADYHIKIIGGFPDGNFHPNDKVTRAQVAAMLNRALSLDYEWGANFTDVPSEHWAYSDILAMKENGIVGGYSNGKFLPNNNITRAELAVILARAFEFNMGENNKTFNDLNTKNYAWAKNSILTLAQNGIIGGYSDGSFRPDSQVTRAEFATFLARILDYGKRLSE